MKPKKTSSWIPRTWSFEASEVAKRFDAHVREQLPWYDLLIASIAHVGAHYIGEEGQVYDIGASTGNLTNLLEPYAADRRALITCVEKSKAMGERAKTGITVEWVMNDAIEVEYKRFDFAVLNLVLMFLPISERGLFVRRLCSNCKPGGAIVIVDKIQSPAGYLGTVMRRLAMKWKTDAGATPDEILAKELSLGGIQRPIDTSIIPVGAVRFFQFGEFAGWIWEKPETWIDVNPMTPTIKMKEVGP